jgi:hypothetical protein
MRPKRVCIIGSEGKIATRYKAILKSLGQEFCCYDTKLECGDDPKGPWYLDFDASIIASPTDTHTAWLRALTERGCKRILCEKPLHFDIAECESVKDLNFWVVNNYAHLLDSITSWIRNKEPLTIKKKIGIVYKYFNTGSDGVWFDLCQLCYLTKRENIMLGVDLNSPIWTLALALDGGSIDIPYNALEMSYFLMLKAFLDEDTRLKWDAIDGIAMTRAALEASDRHTGKDGVYSVSWQNL